MRANGTDQDRLTDNAVTDDSPTISPNGITLAFTSERDGDSDIILWVAGFEFNLTSDSSAHDASPAFSPDGNKIAFTSNRSGNYDIHVMDTDDDTDDATNLSNNPAFDAMP